MGGPRSISDQELAHSGHSQLLYRSPTREALSFDHPRFFHHSFVQPHSMGPVLLMPVANPPNLHNRPSSSNPSSSFCRSSNNMSPSTCVPRESNFDEVIHRMQQLSIPSSLQSSPQPSPSISFHPPSNPKTPMGGGYTLESPFSYPWPEYVKDSQDESATIIDSFAPRPLSFDLSPTSSASSDPDRPMSSISSMSRRSSIDSFTTTQSRVVRVSGMV